MLKLSIVIHEHTKRLPSLSDDFGPCSITVPSKRIEADLSTVRGICRLLDAVQKRGGDGHEAYYDMRGGEKPSRYAFQDSVKEYLYYHTLDHEQKTLENIIRAGLTSKGCYFAIDEEGSVEARVDAITLDPDDLSLIKGGKFAYFGDKAQKMARLKAELRLEREVKVYGLTLADLAKTDLPL